MEDHKPSLESREDKVELALTHFGPMMEGKPKVSQASLAKKYEVDPSVISRTIAEVFANGWVEIRPVAEPDAVMLDESLARRLEDAFDLESALVVQTGPEPSGADELWKYSDDVHRRLGWAVADHAIAHRMLFRDGDALAIGSGRASYQFSSRLYQRGVKFRARDVKLVSLTGFMIVGDHSGASPHEMDADFNLSLVRFAFRAPHCYYVESPITPQEDEAGLPGKLDEHWQKLFPGDTGPAHGLLGVGVLSPGHRLWLEGDDVDRPLEPLRDLLEELVEHSTSFREQYGLYPVIDLSNRLEVLVSGEEEPYAKRLHTLVDEVNARLLTPTWDQLRSIQSIMLIAGTARKTRPILRFLRDKKLNVRLLCTDSNVATSLLQQAQEEGG